ncbi:hypothetical protein [Actinotignum timonense]|nr:hypothetical protein [Actinotignum timonense]MDK6591552.1 hypothetical protein [Actinotignum timonense]
MTKDHSLEYSKVKQYRHRPTVASPPVQNSTKDRGSTPARE